MHTYNSAAFGDCVSAHRVCVHIFNASRYAQPTNATEYSYGIHIDSSYNDELFPTTISLPFDIFTSNNSPNYGVSYPALPITTVVHPEVGYKNGVFLHPNFSASESIAEDIQTLFVKRFGIPFQAQYDE